MIWIGGCGDRPEVSPTPRVVAAIPAPDLDAEIARASRLGRPLLVLVAEPAKGGADRGARGLLESAAPVDGAGRVVPVALDLGSSRNRATAARYPAVETPLLLCLSPRGLIVSRDEGPIDGSLIRRRIDEAGPLAAAADAGLAALENRAADDADAGPRLALADYLQARGNLREAIPHLSAVAHSESTGPAERVRAWVDLAMAHLRIAEPEKARREADALIAAWGSRVPEAMAGGKLALARHDARMNRASRARRGFADAIAAAPDSIYASQARDELAKLPEGEE